MTAIAFPTIVSGAMLLGAYDPQSLNPAVPDRVPDNLDTVIVTMMFMLAGFGLIFTSNLKSQD